MFLEVWTGRAEGLTCNCFLLEEESFMTSLFAKKTKNLPKEVTLWGTWWGNEAPSLLRPHQKPDFAEQEPPGSHEKADLRNQRNLPTCCSDFLISQAVPSSFVGVEVFLSMDLGLFWPPWSSQLLFCSLCTFSKEEEVLQYEWSKLGLVFGRSLKHMPLYLCHLWLELQVALIMCLLNQQCSTNMTNLWLKELYI